MSLTEKESEWLRTIVLPEILKSGQLVANYSESKADTFSVESIDIKVIGSAEAFMLTQCYRATVNFAYAGEQLTLKLVVKKTPAVPPDVYDAVQFGDLFSNETNFYTKILPEIQKLTNGQFAAPKYYYSDLQLGSAVLILGDFGADNWRVTKERVGLSLEHARIAAKYLGRFHGFGYALKHNYPDRFAELTRPLKESRYAKDTIHPTFELILKTSMKRAVKAVTTYQPQVDKDFVTKLYDLTGDYVYYGRQRVAAREPLATLCHGDYLRNNVAYKYDENDEPLDMMMFDYQTLRYSSPMIDLTVFLALSVYADVRHTHFDSIFDDYCTALFDSYREYSKGELPGYINREELLKEYIRFLPYGVTIAASFLMSLVDPPTVSPEEMLNNAQSDEEVIEDVMTRGGEITDRELANQIKELFELSRLHNVEIDDGIVTKR